jgi:hypothetical protein
MLLMNFFTPGPRLVEDEWLDHLPADDPTARRSRRDLRLINALMGNERWVLRALRRQLSGPAVVHEWGAGDGALTRQLASVAAEGSVIGYDLQARSADLPAGIGWRQGDLTLVPPPVREAARTAVLVVNLFLHHFAERCPAAFQAWWPQLDLIIINEPWRLPLAHFWGRLLHPLINDVTRHDMHVSIRAGFAGDEMISFLGLPHAEWHAECGHDWRGAQRWVLRRVAAASVTSV